MSKSSEGLPPPVGDVVVAKLEMFTGHLLRRAQQEHASLWASRGPKDLTSPQFAVLSDLYVNTASPQVEIGDRLGIDRSTLAEMLGRLVDRGLVESERDPADGRRRVTSLTELGRQRVLEGSGAVQGVHEELVVGLTSAERDCLNLLLKKLLIR